MTTWIFEETTPSDEQKWNPWKIEYCKKQENTQHILRAGRLPRKAKKLEWLPLQFHSYVFSSSLHPSLLFPFYCLKEMKKSLEEKCLTRTYKKTVIWHEIYTFNISYKGIYLCIKFMSYDLFLYKFVLNIFPWGISSCLLTKLAQNMQ